MRPIVGLAAVLAVAVAGAVLLVTRRDDVAPAQRPGAVPAFRGIDGSRPIVVWAVGDGGVDSRDARAVARRIAAGRPARVLYLGDVYEDGTAAEFRDNFQATYGSLVRRMLPTPGNHEWPNHAEGYDPFWRRVTGRRTPSWYAVRLGAWQVLSLNSEAPHGAGSAQLQWLRRQLRRPASCRLAFWHRPRFSAGKHGDQEDVAPLWNAVRGRAALVLNGHDHDSQRLRPIGGTTELVAGAGGRSHYAVRDGDRRLAYADDRRDAALRLVLRPGRADLAFVSAGGRVLDRARVPCAG
jgi:Calcineurin-like phosphoesterase